MDLFYGDRRGMVRDPFGNIWQIATHKGLTEGRLRCTKRAFRTS